MKILNIENIRKGDAYTIANEPIASIDLMERAAMKCSSWIMDEYAVTSHFSIFAGIGNNGGDTLAIAKILSIKGFEIEVFIVDYSDKHSNDFKINHERLMKTKIPIKTLTKDNFEFQLRQDTKIIEGIFGSGLSRPASGFTAQIINQINHFNVPIISIDIASGLFADKINDEKNPSIIHPSHTLSLAFPKLAFFLPENEIYVGQWHNMDIGILPEFTSEAKETAYLVEKEDVKSILMPRSRFAHKGNYGHGLLIAGSYSKMGAAVLASKSSLRTGIGLLTTHIPSSAINILQTAVPEAMLSIDSDEKFCSEVKNLEKYNNIGIGPGLGIKEQTQLTLKLLLQNTSNPMVIDADALNILSENKTWLAFLPKNSILTPHPKEFERLAGKSYDSIEKLEKQKSLSVKFNIYIILKGSYTSISTPSGKLYFNSTGNPGMATAGSGDVLTGIILSLLSQKYSPEEASILGVFLHGLAGDFAALKKGFEAMIATDIVDNLPDAFIELHK
jgi:NAD(P)H-hydrate epimerase